MFWSKEIFPLLWQKLGAVQPQRIFAKRSRILNVITLILKFGGVVWKDDVEKDAFASAPCIVRAGCVALRPAAVLE